MLNEREGSAGGDEAEGNDCGAAAEESTRAAAGSSTVELGGALITDGDPRCSTDMGGDSLVLTRTGLVVLDSASMSSNDKPRARI